MKSIRLFSVIAFLCMSNSIFAQNLTFTNDDYKKALWMTTRFYGAQRSGNGPNWLLCYHEGKGNISPGSAYKDGKSFIKDADGNYDLSGGWFDCGDHVKFGQTEFYSAYMLLLGYSEFPAGYDDYYSFDYSGYRAAKDYSWAGKKGKPNGIPDILDEVKYATDYFQKVIRDKNTFYYQVGDGDADHKQWVTSSKMSTLSIDNGGESSGSRKVLKATGSVTSMASLCGATLAAMARLYKPFDPTYAAACLSKALVCYDFVTGTTKGNTGGGSYYPSKTSYNPDMTVFFAELYRTTGESKYLTAAESAAAYITGSSTWNHNWSISYNNTEDLGFYLMAVTNSSIAATAKDRLKYYTETLYKPNSGYLLDKQNDKWGILRYPANQSLIYALYDKLQGKTTVNPYVAASIDHILGNNTKKLSFVVGFTPSASGYTHAKWPHHRNYYGSDANNAGGVSQQSGLEFGFMCGAQSFDASTYPDNLAGYEASEGGIDYNAGLVGALGYINSIVAPVNINKFGHPTPELGEAKSLCGTGSATLTATVDMSALASGESVTYKWYKGTATTPFEQGDTKTSVSVTSADTYRCDLVEKSGKWTTSGTVVVTATLPDVTLGSDVTLCTETSKTFDAVVSGTGITYTWKKDNATIAGATAKTYTAYTAGTYSVIVAASGCTSKTASAKVTSQLPQVQNDTICKAGTANLAVVTSGTYDWYDVATGGTKLASGSTYAPSITANKTYYVQDASSVSASVGPKTATSNTSSNWGISEGLQLAFTVNSSFSINSLKAMVYSVYSAGSGTITIEILDGSGNSFSPKKTFTSNATNVTTTGLATFTFSNFNIDKAWGSNLRMRLTAKTINGDLGFNESGASYPYNSSPQGVVTITGSYGSNSNAYMYFYDWQISAGSTCSRTPVLALIDGTLAKCALDTQAPTQPGALAFSNVEETSVSVAWTASTDNKAVTGYEVSVNGVLKTTVSTPTVNLTGLTANTEYSISVVAIDAAGNKSTARTGTVSTKETPDTQAPTQPGALAFSNVEETSVSVAWTASTDNKAVSGYEVSVNGVLKTTVSTPTVNLTGLTANTEYSISVVAIDAAGNKSTARTGTVSTKETPDTQAPTQPGVLAFSNVEETSVNVTWTASTDNKAVTGYEVSVNGVLKTTVSTPTVNLTGLTANTEYSISVVAIDAAGNKSTARTGTVSTKETPDTQAPTQPGVLAFSNVEETSVNVTWTASTDNKAVSGYEVSVNGVLKTTVSTPTVNLTGLTANTEYSISVVAIDAAGNKSTARTGTVSTKETPDTQAPTQPGALAFSNVEETSVSVAWTASTDNKAVSGYEVSVNGVLKTTVTTPSATLTGLTANTAYTISVVAVDAAGNKSTARTGTVSTKETPDTQAPTQPGALAFSNVEETSVSVAWTASTDNKAVTGYEVSVNGVLKTTVSTPTVNLTGLTANTEYSISVVAIDAAGNKSTARTGTVTTKTSPDTESPTTPGNVAVSDLNNNEYTVTWTASTDNEGVAGYEVWIDGSLYQTVTNGTGITVPALWATDESKTITVSVRAVDNSGNRSAHSSEVQKTFDAQNPTLTQTISLQAGWNLISIYVVPDNAAVEAIFAAILPQIDIVKNEDGFYKPGVAAPLQSLIELKAGYGYLVQAKSAVTLSIQGKVAKNVSVALKPGWNMIGYPFAQAKATTATLSSVWANAREIKNFDGFLTKTSGTLNTMNAGKGYYIYVESVGVLSF